MRPIILLSLIFLIASTTTADDTLSLCYDGTNWFETKRSVN